jgi:hypothetical protein
MTKTCVRIIINSPNVDAVIVDGCETDGKDK